MFMAHIMMKRAFFAASSSTSGLAGASLTKSSVALSFQRSLTSSSMTSSAPFAAAAVAAAAAASINAPGDLLFRGRREAALKVRHSPAPNPCPPLRLGRRSHTRGRPLQAEAYSPDGEALVSLACLLCCVVCLGSWDGMEGRDTQTRLPWRA